MMRGFASLGLSWSSGFDGFGVQGRTFLRLSIGSVLEILVPREGVPPKRKHPKRAPKS